ncbi:CASTOR/POLLUX-related putative ion channel [Nocardioides panacisoli]|uniref:Lipoprotein n=1 Tax=Nocardioides panacisoli TaxID=627624 RepID=A0ABP7IT30_9ACTN
MARTGQAMRRRTAQAIAQREDVARKRVDTEPGLGARLRYAFDGTISRGTPALIAWLFVVTVALVLGFVALDLLFRLRASRLGFWGEAFYDLLHALDPGTVAGDSGSWQFLVAMLGLTLGGLFIVSALIGVISAGIDNRIADLRRGRSLVLETDHTVILGWSESIFTVVIELAIANESRRRPVVAVLADRDKVAMEEELRAKVPDLRGTRIVCRSGSPTDVDDLRIVRPGDARSVIVLSPDPHGVHDVADPDAAVIKSLLALRSIHAESSGCRVVAQLRDPANLAAARLIDKEGDGRTSLLDVRETVAKLVVQTSRQSGAAAVYRELFDYEGDEIYFHTDHGLDGSTYGDALLAFESLSVIGVADASGTRLNPPMDTPVSGTTLVVVAEDDGVLATAPRSTVAVDATAFSDLGPEQPHPTSAVLIGWNERGPIIVRELDGYAPPGSELTIVTTHGDPELPATERLAVTVVKAPTTDRRVLDAHVRQDLDQVIVLCYSDHLDAEAADAATLITLLHVRDILADASTPIVSEMIDDRNRELAQVADIDDVVVSGEIVSLVVTQLSEDARIEPVLAELLAADGSEVYLRPAEWYVVPATAVAWATVVASAARRGETAIGFASEALAEDGSSIGVVVNPPKSRPLSVVPGDRVVVLAED